MILHGICRYVIFDLIDNDLLLLGENHNKNVTNYNRYDENNVILYLLNIIENNENHKYNLFIEDCLQSREKHVNKQYFESPLPKLRDLFRYGEFSNFNNIPIDIRDPNKSHICSLIKTNEYISNKSINMTQDEIILYNNNFNIKIKPYIKEIFEYFLCKNISENGKKYYDDFFKLLLETALVPNEDIKKLLFINDEYRKHIIYMIEREKNNHPNIERFYECLFSSLFNDITAIKLFDMLASLEMDIYFLLKFTKNKYEGTSIYYTGAIHTDNVKIFIKNYYNIEPIIDSKCNYDENIVI